MPAFATPDLAPFLLETYRTQASAPLAEGLQGLVPAVPPALPPPGPNWCRVPSLPFSPAILTAVTLGSDATQAGLRLCRL